MVNGVVTFIVEGAKDEVHDAQERILAAVEKHCSDLPLHISEDTWEEINPPATSSSAPVPALPSASD